MSNTPDGTVHRSYEIQDAILRVLPRPLADWLRYEANADFDPVPMFRAWRNGRTVDAILRDLNSINRGMTLKTYGRDHPCLTPTPNVSPNIRTSAAS